jgi:hypothetical protein
MLQRRGSSRGPSTATPPQGKRPAEPENSRSLVWLKIIAAPLNRISEVWPPLQKKFAYILWKYWWLVCAARDPSDR